MGSFVRAIKTRRRKGVKKMPAKDPVAKDSQKNNQKSILILDEKVSAIARKTRGSTYRFQMKWEQQSILSSTAVPLVICLSNFSNMRAIFQARDDSGGMNDFIERSNKVRAGISGLNYSISIDNATMPVFTVSVFIVKLKKTAKHMLDLNTAGEFSGADLTTEKDYVRTPALGNANSQMIMLNKNVFKILYHKRHVLGSKISPLPLVGGVSVTNRRDTIVDKYYKLKHDKIYKAPYGNGWLTYGGVQKNQETAGRPYLIIFPQDMSGGSYTGNATLGVQQVTTFKTI